MYKAEMYRAEMFKIKKLKLGALITSLVVSLLMLSTSAQAESNTVSENGSGQKLSEQAYSGQSNPDPAYSDQKRKSIAVTDNDAHQGATHLDINPQGDLPHWPENRPMKQKLIPPPPPGPYMSTAMSNHVVRGSAYGPNRGQMRGQPRSQTGSQAHRQPFSNTRNNSAHHNPARSSTRLAMPMQMYSPDRPWPDNLRPQPRRMPESGYRHGAPAVPHNAPPPVNNGYRTGSGNSHTANRYRSQPGSYHPGGYQPQGSGINQLKKHAQHPRCDRYKKHHLEQDRQAQNMPTHNRPIQSGPAQSISTQGRP